MLNELVDQIVYTDYGQFDVLWLDEGGYDGNDEKFFKGQVNGILGAGDANGICVTLARRSGGSSIRVVLHQMEPPVGAEWDDVVEASTVVPPGADPAWASWAQESGGSLAVPTGPYRVRLSCRGRDVGRQEEFAERVVDFYQLDLWPAAAADDAIIRAGSHDARYWHEVRGTRQLPGSASTT